MQFNLHPTKNILTACLFIAVALSSCANDELKEPAGVYFAFKLDREPPANPPVAFQSGTMDIESIAFIGDRESGDDIGFVSDFGTIVHADLATGNSDPVIMFDIPQGNYTQIRLTVDPDDTKPDIVLMGNYVPAIIGPSIPVRLEIDIPAALNLTATTATGSNVIVLQKDSGATVEIFLNPSRWIADIPLLAFETAQLQDISGVPSILISKDFNTDIYSQLPALINASAEAIIR